MSVNVQRKEIFVKLHGLRFISITPRTSLLLIKIDMEQIVSNTLGNTLDLTIMIETVIHFNVLNILTLRNTN